MILFFRQLLAAIISLGLATLAFCEPRDAVGNRKQLTSTLAPVPAGLWNYDANDRFTAGDTYDNNGNTISSGGVGNAYDFENYLIQKVGVTIVYDGDGNRVAKTVNGVMTRYLVDAKNPTGYAQAGGARLVLNLDFGWPSLAGLVLARVGRSSSLLFLFCF
jgi:hypothetical protein